MTGQNHKENLKKTYNKIAEDWNQDHLDDVWSVEAARKYGGMFKTGADILDIGCGSGLKSISLIEIGLDITGIDISSKMIGIAKKNVPKGKFEIMDMENITLEKKYDGVFAQACLLHARKKDAPGVIKHWVTLLKNGGYLYIAVKESNKNINEEIVKENDYGYEYERFFSFYSKEEIEKYMADVKLKIIYSTITFSGKTNWVQVIGKRVI
ncbi:MAG: hypothetical protein HW405_91 [Candidatus Berkelbacteria bacterium]|nr:hypothetical protein [Candidatus Berkelbacteria bacterium]